MRDRASPRGGGGPPDAWRGVERATAEEGLGRPAETDSTTATIRKPDRHKAGTLVRRERRQLWERRLSLNAGPGEPGERLNLRLRELARSVGHRPQELIDAGLVVRDGWVRETDWIDLVTALEEQASALAAHERMCGA